MGLELSPPVAARLDEAVEVVVAILRGWGYEITDHAANGGSWQTRTARRLSSNQRPPTGRRGDQGRRPPAAPALAPKSLYRYVLSIV